jgi:hypothetical protein
MAAWLHLLFVAVFLCGFAPAPFYQIAHYAAMAFLPQVLVVYVFSDFLPATDALLAKIALAIFTCLLAFPFSLLYAAVAQLIARTINRWRSRRRQHATI